jgi:hypothetical protein
MRSNQFVRARRRSILSAIMASAALCSFAGSASAQFVDNFNNGSIPDSDTRPGFWNQVVDGNGTLTETAGGHKITLRSQSVGVGNAFPYTELASPLQNDFNFFRAPIVIGASGLGYAAGDSTLALTQFTITSQALDSNGPQTEYQAEDSISLWITNRLSTNNGTGVGTLVMGIKEDAPNRSSAFEGYPLIGQVGNVYRGVQAYAGQVRAFRLIIAPTFFDLVVSHDTSTTNPAQVSVHYTGGLDIYRTGAPYGANWTSGANTAGDSAVNIQTQLNNTPSATPVANFSMTGFSVTKFQQTWVGNSFDNWSNPAAWSDPDVQHPNGDFSTSNVPNFVGANVRFAQSAGPVTVIADADETLGAMIFDSSQPYTVTVNGGGQGTLHLASRYTQSELRVMQGQHTVFCPVIFEAGSDALLTADTASAVLTVPVSLTVSQPGSQNITKAGPGRVEVPTARCNTLTLSGGTLRILDSDGSLAGRTSTLSDVNSLVTSGGLLDLRNNDLIVRNGDIAALQAAVKSWYAGGARNGPGLGSSLSTASSYTTLAVVLNSASGQPYFPTFDGSSVSASDVLVKYTYLGDTNLDGKLDGLDYKHIMEGYVNGLSGWMNGDVDYSGGAVTLSDVQAFLAAYNYYTANAGSLPTYPSSETTAAAAAIPDPGAGSLAASIGLLSLTRRRPPAHRRTPR